MGLIEARRLLHVCYCCSEVEAAAGFFGAGCGFAAKMRTTGRNDGVQLDVPGTMDSDVIFMFDRRGARSSPAIEVQGWIVPPAEGSPYAEPSNIGLQALGLAVPDLAAAGDRLGQAGAVKVGEADEAVFGAKAAIWRDPSGALIDVLEDAGVEGATRFAHLRMTCADLGPCLDWYQQLGFALVESPRVVRAEMGSLRGRLEVCVLQLPDEPTRLLLIRWIQPASTGTSYDRANHRGWYRLAIAVDDTQQAYQSLSAAGWNFTDPPRLTQLSGTPVPDMWIAFTRDPNNIPVELVQRPRSAFR
ncbi:MAG TPA: VOC family protein [Acidimicrobiales bacterium]|nr:VOC family protein [Acidimicrobiales bacterium]